MVIDFHTHFYPNAIAERAVRSLEINSHGVAKAFTSGTRDALLSSMREAGIDISVVLPVSTKPSQFDTINRVAEETSAMKGLISFGGIHPDNEDIPGKMKYLKSRGFKGIKIHPDYQRTHIDDERYIVIISEAVKNDMIVVTHAGVDPAFLDEVMCTPQRSVRMLDKVQEITGVDDPKIVFAHTGGIALYEDVLKYLAGRNCYFDTAYTLGAEKLEITKEIIEKHGTDRILFASDTPWSQQQNDINRLSELGLSIDEYEKISWKNASNLLGLTPVELATKSLFN